MLAGLSQFKANTKHCMHWVDHDVKPESAPDWTHPFNLAWKPGSWSRFTSFFLHLLTWPDMIARLPKAMSSCQVKSEGVKK